MLLEKLLVLALEVDLKDHTADLSTLFAETLFLAEVRAVEGRVMRQLTRPADAGMECLVTGIADIAPVGIEQTASARRQRDGALASVERDGPNQSFVSQVVQGVVADVTHIPWIAEVPLGHDPERARCGESAALLAIDLVTVIAV